MYIYYIYVEESFSLILDKGLRKNSKQRDRKIAKHKLNEIGTLNMKQKM